ncbi:YbaB/EbfC family nucleoid-associated protein [Nocardia uniformis]|uniref:YbaB/EbfC family nucleoid-associated protein n=1 Tax=Nocardia uniformis TaxID=53432 RepID=A0A849C4G4_9NOCA|nr:YbaB/EbfC family nucleoid-associated protein [Nocardia uniformis]NNH73522.1 YbaB/EbfC family nucleoid-associated protein [Nocardia uniformis]
MSEDGRFEEIARKARHVQDAVERVRASVSAPGVRIEVAADGRITGLELTDPTLAEAISAAHSQALRQADERVAKLRRELADDPIVSSMLRRFIASDIATPNSAEPAPRWKPAHPEDTDDYENPHALPPDVRRRYGL